LPVIGLTGGVASGKSSASQILIEELASQFFDADCCVHDLLASDDTVRDAIVAAFGPAVCDPSGRPDRAALRDQVFADSARRRVLEDILHPAVRARWMALAASARAAGAWLLVDIPLLYETGAETHFDRTIVVACHRRTQLLRLTENRGLAPAMAARIINSQFDLGEKTQKADHVIWNDSTVSNLDGQCRLLAAWLRRRFA
jgi:dephospho-CoA kinase